ncbi:MAG TPA: response regulator transcription factor [Ktedonobacteraceae bacterium]|jgi:DNA-binding response OmpR family regulator|nr:response regulator transcription factor [Ktedonobacteraceae bacterium]
MRILLAEDDVSLGTSIKKGLEEQRYAVDLVHDGTEALTMSHLVTYDLVILDVLLPEVDGFEVCRQLRKRVQSEPILFLTALNDVDNRVTGLDIGGDDYLVKPFAFRELEARVRALLRRESTTKTTKLHFMDIVLDTRTHEVWRNNRQITLTAKEHVLLDVFLRHPHQVLSRAMIAERLWNIEADNLSNVIDVYIGYLRRKLCENGEPNVIHTVRGFGYQLKEP